MNNNSENITRKCNYNLKTDSRPKNKQYNYTVSNIGAAQKAVRTAENKAAEKSDNIKNNIKASAAKSAYAAAQNNKHTAVQPTASQSISSDNKTSDNTEKKKSSSYNKHKKSESPKDNKAEDNFKDHHQKKQKAKQFEAMQNNQKSKQSFELHKSSDTQKKSSAKKSSYAQTKNTSPDNKTADTKKIRQTMQMSKQINERKEAEKKRYNNHSSSAAVMNNNEKNNSSAHFTALDNNSYNNFSFQHSSDTLHNKAAQLNNSLSKDIERYRSSSSKTEAIKNTERHLSVSAKAIASYQQFNARNFAMKEQMKRQQFKRIYNNTVNSENKELDRKIENQQRYIRYLQFQSHRNSIRATRPNSYEKAKKAAEAVKTISRVAHAGDDKDDIGSAAASVITEPAKIAAERAAARLLDKTAPPVLNKAIGGAAFLAKELDEGHNAGEIAVNSAKHIAKKQAMKQLDKTADKLHQKHTAARQNRIDRKINREARKAENLRQEKMRQQRINFYKEANGFKEKTMSLSMRDKIKEFFTTAAKETIKNAGSTAAIAAVAPIFIIIILLIIICSLFSWMSPPKDKTDRISDKEILQGYIEDISNFYEDKQIEILCEVDRFWGGFEPMHYAYGSSSYIEYMDQYENRWIKLGDIDYEDIIALAAVKKFHELETGELYESTDEEKKKLELNIYDLEITQKDLTDVSTNIYEYVREVINEPIPTSPVEKEIVSSTPITDEEGNTIAYWVSHDFDYNTPYNDYIQKGQVINFNNYGLEFILRRTVKSNDETISTDMAVFEVYQGYIDNVLGTSTLMPDYENDTAARQKLAEKAADKTGVLNEHGMYVCPETRTAPPAPNQYYRVEKSAPENKIIYRPPYGGDVNPHQRIDDDEEKDKIYEPLNIPYVPDQNPY